MLRLFNEDPFTAELSVLECLGAASAWECLSWEGSQEIICPDEGGKVYKNPQVHKPAKSQKWGKLLVNDI